MRILSRSLAGATAIVCLARPIAAQSGYHAGTIPALTQQAMTLANGDVHLSGTLYMPEHGDHVPAVVVFWGAQAPTREFAMYQQLATGLPAIGVAVLVFDRRGSGQSTGNAQNQTFEELASDGIAALHVLQHTPRIDPKRVGFWGLSQGGWLSILAASKTSDAAFAIACSAPLVTPADQMTFAVTNLFTVRGYGREALDQALALRQTQAAYSAGHGSYDATLAATRQVTHQRWYSDAFLRDTDELPKTTPDTAWLRVMQYDPITPLEAVHIPLLIFYGGADPWVPVAASVARLKPIAARKPNISYYVIANADHVLSFPKQQTMDWDKGSLENEKPESAEYFLVMASWLTRHLGLGI
jgi:uncharacterized protein